MRIYFVRHGESKYNALLLHQHKAVELSDKGREQAKTVAKRFQNIQLDVILASHFNRAHDTALEIHTMNGAPLEIAEIFHETKKPTEIENKKYDEPDVIVIKEKMMENIENESWHYSDEENWYDMRNRAVKAWEFLATRKEKNVAVVTHGDFLKMLVAVMFFGKDLQYKIFKPFSEHLRHVNTGITLCEETNSGVWKLVTWNDHAHLG